MKKNSLMKTLGITGSIGMGKSEAAKCFAKNGVPVFDSDACVHNLFQNNQNLKQEIKSNFPQAIDGDQIDRTKLGMLVFNSPEKINILENIVHPHVRAEQERFKNHHKEKNTPLVVFDIPLLFETGAEQHLDKTLVITASKKTQEERVLSRAGMSKERFEAILSLQKDDAEKRKLADFVISSENGREAMQKDIESLIKKLTI